MDPNGRIYMDDADKIPPEDSARLEGFLRGRAEKDMEAMREEKVAALTQAVEAAERKACRHDSMRMDGTLDNRCLRCGADGYWHDGHRHDHPHPSGKVLVGLDCPDQNPETEQVR